MSGARLLFVYNADSGLLNALKDAVHKAVAPGSYPCSLCAATYGAVSMHGEWRDYVERLPYPAVFLHRDEFRRAYPASAEPLPAILLDDGSSGSLRVIVAAADMPLGQPLRELIALLDGRLARQPGQAL